ncbi:hypothetical protein [Candidatus Liberibacter brunswickensis]|uniref:hypothetical protein n=1 Tax=Candidatus Liberibacter brunswickensis TaxID=1968796 RepID=UPI002FE0B417
MITRNFFPLFLVFYLISMASCGVLPIIDDNIEIQEATLEGYWEDDNGILSYFQKDGILKTMSTDGSNIILATGYYRIKLNKEIDIRLNSLVRNTLENIQCKFLDPNKINCIAQNKKQFYLRRTHLTEVPMSKSERDIVVIPDSPTPPSTSEEDNENKSGRDIIDINENPTPQPSKSEEIPTSESKKGIVSIPDNSNQSSQSIIVHK